MSEREYLFYVSKEKCEPGYTPEPGWYFSDECDQLRGNGPFATRREANAAYHQYCKDFL